MKHLSVVGVLLSLIVTQTSFAKVIQCDYEASFTSEQGVLAFEVGTNFISIQGSRGTIAMEHGRNVICGEDQADLRALSCQAELTQSKNEINWWGACQRESGANIWRNFSDAKIKLDMNSKSGLYSCKSLLKEDSRRQYYTLTNCR
ncbi:hypothetical protein [Bdellovibrio sp. HCB2-146]|uniref:hypothetical protein n=1 Tax=Bdellovibrio sp. HCB2-146 TaxID=3394362 RepID=UPI0039BC243C